MKIELLCLIILSALLNFSCNRNVESSPVSVIEKPAETPQSISTPVWSDEIGLIDEFRNQEKNSQPASLRFENYEIKRVSVRKTYDGESPEIDIFDALLSKNGKTVARFEGEYYPLGNEVNFGLFSLLGGTEKQLLVFDESYKYGREWIVSLKPKYEVLFDSKDYGIWWGRLGALDIDRDGSFELTALQSNDLNLNGVTADMPWVKVVFRYDSRIRRYTPANHLFTDFSLGNIDQQVKEFKEGKNAGIQSLLEIMLRYFYAGRENEAWLFFDENFTPIEARSEFLRDKERTREKIKSELQKDPIIKFIRRDLTGKK